MRNQANRYTLPFILLAFTTLVLACDDDPAGPETGGLSFDPPQLALGTEPTGTVSLINGGDDTLQNLSLEPGTVTDSRGRIIESVSLSVAPDMFERLEPGDEVTVFIDVTIPEGLEAGDYTTSLELRQGETSLVTLEISFRVVAEDSDTS